MSALRKVLVVSCLVAALFLPGIARVGARQTHAEPMKLVHVVKQGETLWQIARQVAPGSDAVEIVELLIQANHLRGAGVRPGQPLFLPAG